MLNSTAYLIYIGISAFITVFVSRTLSKNGLTFLIDGFNGNVALAKSTNHLLVVGFYLVNFGFVLLRMQTDAVVTTFDQLIIYLASGIGFVLVILGFAHFFNMYVIHRFRENHVLTRLSQDDDDKLPEPYESS